MATESLGIKLFAYMYRPEYLHKKLIEQVQKIRHVGADAVVLNITLSSCVKPTKMAVLIFTEK